MLSSFWEEVIVYWADSLFLEESVMDSWKGGTVSVGNEWHSASRSASCLFESYHAKFISDQYSIIS